MRDDDEFDEFGERRPSTSANASAVGVVGLIFAGISVGLLLVVAVLWIALDEEHQVHRNVAGKRWMLLWFLFLDVISFFTAVLACILGGRGLTPANPVYRGWSMLALILGLTEICVTIGFGIFLTCFTMLFQLGFFGGR